MINLTANIALAVAAMLDMIVMLGGDITAHHHYGHSNSKYYAWLSKSGELMSSKRLLLLAVFIATFTTMAQQSWMVVMILAATLLVQAIILMTGRQWKLMDPGKGNWPMLATAMLITLIAVMTVAHVGSKISALFATRVTSMFTVMLLPITPLITMLISWLLSPLIMKNGGTDSGDSDNNKESL